MRSLVGRTVAARAPRLAGLCRLSRVGGLAGVGWLTGVGGLVPVPLVVGVLAAASAGRMLGHHCVAVGGGRRRAATVVGDQLGEGGRLVLTGVGVLTRLGVGVVVGSGQEGGAQPELAVAIGVGRAGLVRRLSVAGR